MLKEIISQKRARNLMRKIKKIDDNFEVEMTEKMEFKRVAKSLTVIIPKFWFNVETFGKLIKMLMDEKIYYVCWYFKDPDKGLDITIKYR